MFSERRRAFLNLQLPAQLSQLSCKDVFSFPSTVVMCFTMFYTFNLLTNQATASEASDVYA